MSKILVHALGATAGGGLTYLRHFLSQAALRVEHHWVVLVPQGFPAPPLPPHVEIRAIQTRGLRRLQFDQITVARCLRRERFDVFLATGNFGIYRCPVPQVVMSRNALYFSQDHLRQLFARQQWKELANIAARNRMAVASILAAQVNVVPSAGMRDEVMRWCPGLDKNDVTVIHHGFDQEFCHSRAHLQTETQGLLNSLSDAPKVLMVSHYNYFRNFETVLRGIHRYKSETGKSVHLLLTTILAEGYRDHRYDTTDAYRLLYRLGLEKDVVMLGNIPHLQLPDLYRQCDLTICASYAESFGHPMVEAMACGRPVLASNRPTHREICGPAALHFDPFSANEMARSLDKLISDRELQLRLAGCGKERVKDFTWQVHFEGVEAALTKAVGMSSIKRQSRRIHR